MNLRFCPFSRNWNFSGLTSYHHKNYKFQNKINTHGSASNSKSRKSSSISLFLSSIRGVNLSLARWASTVHLELGLGWIVSLLARKIGPNIAWPDLGLVWCGLARQPIFFFIRQFGSTHQDLGLGWVAIFWHKKIGSNLARSDVSSTQPSPSTRIAISIIYRFFFCMLESFFIYYLHKFFQKIYLFFT